MRMHFYRTVWKRNGASRGLHWLSVGYRCSRPAENLNECFPWFLSVSPGERLSSTWSRQDGARPTHPEQRKPSGQCFKLEGRDGTGGIRASSQEGMDIGQDEIVKDRTLGWHHCHSVGPMSEDPSVSKLSCKLGKYSFYIYSFTPKPLLSINYLEGG